MDTITIYLQASAADLTRWIKDYTQQVYLDFFPMSRGGCTLQSAKSKTVSNQTTSTNEIIHLVMDAFYWDGEVPRSGEIHPWPSAIIFQILPRDARTLEIRITARYQSLMIYCNDLLMAMLMRWPEIHHQLTQLNLAEHTDDLPLPSIWDGSIND